MKIHTLLIVVTLFLYNIAFPQSTEFLSLVVSKKDINISGITLTTIPMLGPYMVAGNKFLSLEEDAEMSDIVFPDSMIVDDIFWTGNDFVVKSGFGIYSIGNLDEPLMDFDTWDYSIFPWDSKRLFVVYTLGDTSRLFLANIVAKRAKRLLTIGEKIVYVAASDKSTMLVTTENIYIFSGQDCKRYLDLWSPLRTAVMTKFGLVFATDNEICLLTGVNEFLLLFEGSCERVLYDGQYLFLQLVEGDLLKCNLNAFLKKS